MNLVKLITLKKARSEIKRLQEYVDLVEGYKVDTLEKWIVKEYAYTNSIVKVTEKAIEQGLTINGSLIDKAFIKNVIDGKATDKLHRILKSGYQQRVKATQKGKNSFL
jgi:hypothetical protein